MTPRTIPIPFVELNKHVFACGRDPYFPAWQDLLQLNAFDSGLRGAAIETVTNIAGQCDGVRCDMAMLLLNSIFERIWAVGEIKPATEYWADLIEAIRCSHPEFLFIAEAYWDREGSCSNKDSITIMKAILRRPGARRCQECTSPLSTPSPNSCASVCHISLCEVRFTSR
jgi:hypothetical protein